MKNGSQHWTYNRDRPATFIIAPRHPNNLPAGWKAGESRVYHWDHAVLLHTAGSWEATTNSGETKLYFESSRIFYSVFPVMGPPTNKPFGDFQADYVRWEIDLTQPTNTRVVEPTVILDMPGEMAMVDERFLTRPYDKLFCPVIPPGKQGPIPPILPIGLHAYAMLDKPSGKADLFDPGQGCTVEEPIFVPRSKEAPEGDSWVLGMIQRMDVNRSDLVVLDTKDFAKPVAVVQLPFRIKGQIHGNWVEAFEERSLTRVLEPVGKVMGMGALEVE